MTPRWQWLGCPPECAPGWRGLPPPPSRLAPKKQYLIELREAKQAGGRQRGLNSMRRAAPTGGRVLRRRAACPLPCCAGLQASQATLRAIKQAIHTLHAFCVSVLPPALPPALWQHRRLPPAIVLRLLHCWPRQPPKHACRTAGCEAACRRVSAAAAPAAGSCVPRHQLGAGSMLLGRLTRGAPSAAAAGLPPWRSASPPPKSAQTSSWLLWGAGRPGQPGPAPPP